VVVDNSFHQARLYDEKWMPRGLPHEVNERESVFENLDAKDKLFLDLGAGTLRFSLAAIQEGAKQVIAVEMLRKSLEWGIVKAHNIGVEKKVNVILADVRFLPLRDNTFDVVVAIELFEHIQANVRLFIQEVHRVLKKSGIAAIDTWNAIPNRLMGLLGMTRKEREYRQGGFYYCYYYPWEFTRVIRSANFSHVKVLGANSTYFFPRLGKITFDKLLRKFRPLNQVTGQFLLAILLK